MIAQDEFMVLGVNRELPKRPPISRALIVEDEAYWQMIIERAFYRIDRRINITFAENANQALDIVSEQSDFDLIVSDYRLGGLKTGLDLWDMLLGQNSEIPYVLLSGIKRSHLMEHLMPYRSEMLPLYYEKPQSVKELIEILKRSISLIYPSY